MPPEKNATPAFESRRRAAIALLLIVGILHLRFVRGRAMLEVVLLPGRYSDLDADSHLFYSHSIGLSAARKLDSSYTTGYRVLL